MRSNISKDVAKAIKSIQKTRNKARILRNVAESPISSIFANLDHKEYEEKLFSQFQKFIEDSNAEIAPINDVSSENIFNLYFEKLSPFGTEKKKSEFPDAFILAALALVSEQESSPVYVVSKDKDFTEGVKHFPGLIHLDSLEKYLNIVALHYENLAPLAIKLMKENENIFKEAIKEHFLNSDLGI